MDIRLVKLRHSIKGNAQSMKEMAGDEVRKKAEARSHGHSKDSVSTPEDTGASRGHKQRSKMIKLPFYRIALIEGGKGRIR